MLLGFVWRALYSNSSRRWHISLKHDRQSSGRVFCVEERPVIITTNLFLRAMLNALGERGLCTHRSIPCCRGLLVAVWRHTSSRTPTFLQTAQCGFFLSDRKRLSEISPQVV